MQQFDQKKAGAMLSYLNIGVKMFAGFLCTPIIIRGLGQDYYGIYRLCISSMGYLTLFNAGMNAAYIRFYVQTKTTGTKGDVEKLNGIFAVIFSILALVAFITGLAISKNPELIFGAKITVDEYQVMKQLLTLLTINTVITILDCIFSSLIIANEKFIIGKSILLFATLLTAVANLASILLGGGAPALVASTVLCNLFSFLVAAWICLIYLRIRFSFRKLSKASFFSVMAFSVFVFLQTIMDQVNWQIDQFLLARFSGSQETAVYALGSQLNSYYILLGTALAEIFLPQINRLVVEKDTQQAISSLFIKVSRIQFIIVVYIMLGFVYFGKYFMQIWGGEGFDNSYYVALLLMLPVTVSLTQCLGLNIMRAKNKHQLQIVLNFLVSLFNLIISIPLCQRYGAIGGAAGTCIGLSINGIFISFFYYQKVGKIDMKQYLKEMCSFGWAMIIPILYGLILNKFDLINSFGRMIAYGILFTVIYFISMWALGINHDEKLQLKAIVKKRIS